MPVELTNEKDAINQRIAELFDKAGIAVVLLDRDLVSYPQRSRYDLVGIDNRRAGHVITAHLLNSGCKRIVFLCRPRSAPTVDARISGYREALAEAGVDFEPYICRTALDDASEVREVLQTVRPDGFVCANDFTAAHLLRTLNGLGVSVPGQVRMAGIDDVKYASLLSVPLTTIHQPCAAIGTVAVKHDGRALAIRRSPEESWNFHIVIRDLRSADVVRTSARRRRRDPQCP